MVDIDEGILFDTSTGGTEEDISIESVLEYETAPEELKKEFDDYLEGWFKKNDDKVTFPDIVPLTFWDWLKERNENENSGTEKRKVE